MTSAGVRSAESATGGQSRTQITVAIIGAVATVLVAIVGSLQLDLLGRSDHTLADGGGNLTGKPLSSDAQKLVDPDSPECLEGKTDAPRTNAVSITSPHPGDEVGTVPGDPGQPASPDDAVVRVEGTVDLHSGESLYLLSYTGLGCTYYFNPEASLKPTSDMHWTWPAYLVQSRGENVTLVAVVADRATGKLFKEIIGHRQDAYLHSLPRDVTRASATIKIRHR
jgi:hypothetical protein